MDVGQEERGIDESELYPPIRDYLAAQGYDVKAEVEHCDVVARRGDEPPVVVELKRHLNLDLVMQAADRLKVADTVYIAFPASAPPWRRHWRRVIALARRLGIGVLTVSRRRVKVRLDPGPYQPRGSATRRARLLREFERRVGDANVGGTTGVPRMTAYRQDALRCVAALDAGPRSLDDVRASSGVDNAASICQRNVYGWFDRVERGVYELSPAGRDSLVTYGDEIAALLASGRERVDGA